MKLNKKTFGAIIILFIVLLLFFSKTIYSYNLPQVTGTRPTRGSLSKLEISSGIASWAETETIFAACAGAVGRVFVREGDKVEKDQILFEMDFDIAAAQRRYAEIGNNIGRLEAEIRSIRSGIRNIREALAADDSRDADASTRDFNLETDMTAQTGLIVLELRRARLVLSNTRLAFELGSQSRNDLINAENNLLALLFKYQNEAENLEHSLALKLIDLENLKITREGIAQVLRDYRNNAVIRAPMAGTISSLAAERGKYFQENAFLVSLGAGQEFIVECLISLDNNFVNPGDICELSNASHAFKGTVQRVRPVNNKKVISISVISDEINDGETFDIAFEKNSTASFILVPSGAINLDNDGYFLYHIKRRRGMMGEEYYVERLNVFLGDSDRQNTAVLRGITFFEPIVLVSDKALSTGITVSLKNPEKFFEN